MTNQEATDLQEKIMNFCRDLQLQHPDWMFARAFAEAQRQHPEWFQDSEVFQETLKDAQKEMVNQKNQIADRQLKEHQQAFRGVAAAGAEERG
jgi:hypothetical protein